MRNVLVPLDGTDLAAAILPDARRLAGQNGELVLVRHVADGQADGFDPQRTRQMEVDAAQLYLSTVAQALRAEGMQVRTQPLVSRDAAVAIDEAAQLFGADVIAVATHGRSAAERWHSGSIAWRALLRSTVPVLIRHVDPDKPFAYPSETGRRRIMVPLDGSPLAESALPLARELAGEWDALIWLVRVVGRSSDDTTSSLSDAEAYLDGKAEAMPGDVHTAVMEGSTVESLVRTLQEHDITDVVMSSHGRTAVSRAIVGSVLDDLIHSLRCPLVVVPMLAAVPSGSEGPGAGFGFKEHPGAYGE